MHTRLVRFTSQWALVGVTLFFTVGIAMIARHMERIVTPTSAVGSECATIPEMPNLPEPLVGEYWQDSATGIIQSNEEGPNLKLFGDVYGTLTSSPSPVENAESDGHDFDTLGTMRANSAAGSIEEDELVIYLKEEQETITRLGTEQFSNGSDTTETPLGQNIEKTSDTVRTCTPAKPVLTKIQTKIRCVEAILKKAVIEPYHINGQIEGLRITGLDRIAVARDLLLKSGDIIRAVNGHSLNSKRRAYEIFKRARTRPTMIIDLLQDGEAKTLLFDFR